MDAADGTVTQLKRHSPLAALVLVVPAPSIGVLLGMILAPGSTVGRAVFALSKLWILVLPLAWHLRIEKQKPSWSRPSQGGFAVAALLGLVMSAGILAVFVFWGDRLIEAERMREMAAAIGLSDARLYLAFAAYWILVNSVLEEYVWRWFVVRQCERLMPPIAAVPAAALGFTLHHVLAMQVFFSPIVTTCAAVAIFSAGAAWSWCYLRYRSIWPGYLSHAMVDAAVFGLGYVLIFE